MKLAAIFTLFAGSLSAEVPGTIGIIGGIGGFPGASNTPTLRSAGAEFCIGCAGIGGLFLDYRSDLYGKSYAYYGGVLSAGVRIQWPTTLQPFIDIGFALAHTPHRGSTDLKGGGEFGTGVNINIHRHWYVRPQLRATILGDVRPPLPSGGGIRLTDSMIELFGGIGIGYRF